MQCSAHVVVQARWSRKTAMIFKHITEKAREAVESATRVRRVDFSAESVVIGYGGMVR